ncbi:MAG TPA: LCP family protein [Streptosporangiaceae bacterium]|nr:LCP family protein [Streptosporangiaceae bacterium]
MARRRMTGLWYPLTCLAAAVVLVVSGFSYFVIRDVASIGGSHAIASGPSVGAQNILLMGLESRRDWNGNILPNSILAKLHAGNAQAVANGTGGNDTNTLILIHIFAGGKRAVGFSIPRDDWVDFADTVGPQQAGKIDQAYGVSMFYEQAKLRQQDPGMSQDQLAFLGNEAGRRAAVGTVEQLTGVHVDHFAEVNLDGFYELAKVFGGVEVCLNHNVYDPKSGAHFHRGYQHLDAAQALSFVRQRDGLPNGDLDRTHRQQAFIDSVVYQLRTEGVLSDLTKVSALLSVAKQYVITDAGWNLLDFAAQMRGLSSRNLVFRTLPIKGYATIDGQDANEISVPYTQRIVHAAFFPAPVHRPVTPHRARAVIKPSATATTVDVFNGGRVAGLAARVSAALVKAGYRPGQIANTAPRTATGVSYGAGAAANAAAIARLFGVTAVPSAVTAPGHVQVLLGSGAALPSALAPRPATSAPSIIPTAGPQGGAVVVPKDGIPCVN